MQLRVILNLIDEQYHSQLSVESLTAEEQQALSQFGPWLVDLGGEFDDQQGLTFTLPHTNRQLPQQFPVKRLFDLKDDQDANARAVLWLETLITRITDARTQALAKTPGTEFDEVRTYPEA